MSLNMSTGNLHRHQEGIVGEFGGLHAYTAVFKLINKKDLLCIQGSLPSVMRQPGW